MGDEIIKERKNGHCRKNAILASLQNFCNGCILVILKELI
jgi:hypothetical protein